MARNLQLALQLLARDTGSKVLKQALQSITRDTRAAQKADDELAKSRQQNTTSAIRASRTLQDEYRRASSARSTLGIRSEREIQREIQQTMAAYNRLTRTGMLSANEQSRAFRAMTDRVKNLRTELVGVNDSMTRMQRMKAAGSKVAAVAGGLTAAGVVLSGPVSKQMDYRQRLAMMANTAYADKGLEGRREGMGVMDSLIRRAVRTGGGAKETAADTLDTLLASGAVDMKSAQTLLPVLQKSSTATGAAPTDLAKIAIRLKQSFGIADADVGKALNMAISAGQGGSFELADMAKWLPQQLAAASNNGMKGLDDFAVLLGLNQSAAITAGSSDEAGNNVVNLLAKISSQDAASAAARIKLNGGKKGIDLPGSLAKAQGQGINSLDAFVGIIDKVVANNKEYQKLEAKLKNAKPGERQQLIESQAKILEGSSVGKMVADRQALMALIGYRSNRKYATDIKDDANKQRNIAAGQSAGDINFALMSEQPGFKTGQLKNEREFAEIDSVAPLSDVLGDISEKLTKYADEYPGLTKAVSQAELGIKAMTAAAIAFAGLNFLTGAAKVAGGSAGGIPAAGSTALGKTWQFLRSGAGKVLGRIAAPLALYKGMEDAPLVHVERGDADARERLKTGNYSSSEARMLDAVKARPGLLDAVDEVKAWWNSPATIGQPSSAAAGVPSYLIPNQQKPQSLTITTNLMLDGRTVAQAVNEYNGEQSVRGSTGGTQ